MPTVAFFPIDDPLRAYAIDSHGRQTWGRAAPHLRWFYDNGWRPLNADTSLAQPSKRPLYTMPIAPVWQVWKPREQRGSWRRRADYRTQRWRGDALRTALTPKPAPDEPPATPERTS